jgi:Domain of unknown function (DUF397)
MNWRKSTHSGGNGGDCVEVAQLPHGTVVRDSKDQTGPVLRFAAGEWQAFLSAVKDGRLAGKSL